MTTKEIIHHRLINQQIAGTKFTKPEEIVSYMGAMQSQDWHMAKWAIGLRIPGIKEADVEKSFNNGKILRTHVLRPTWHFVAPADIKWMEMLTSPRVHQLARPYYKRFGLDRKVMNKCYDILIISLRDKNYRTREDLNAQLKKERIMTDRLKLGYIMIHAELDGLICSGPRVGKQFTYALVDERAPNALSLHKEEALYKLTSKYFMTRGPATIQDFTWWSGLTVKEAKEGIANLDSKFLHENMNGKEFIFYDHPVKDIRNVQSTFLIPDYDEYGISYKDRSIYNHPKMTEGEKIEGQFYIHGIAVEGFNGGKWVRTTKGNKPVIKIYPFKSLTVTQLKTVDKALLKYMNFYS
jgi:hypothetical protein